MVKLIDNKKDEKEIKKTGDYLVYHEFDLELDLSNIKYNVTEKKKEIGIRTVKRNIR